MAGCSISLLTAVPGFSLDQITDGESRPETYEDARREDNVERAKAHIEARKRKPATVQQAIADLQGSKPIDRWKITRSGTPTRYAASLRTNDGTFTGHMSTKHSDKVQARFKSTKPGTMERVGRHPRLNWDGQCPTLRAGTGSDLGSYQSVRPIHPDGPRVITVREAAHLTPAEARRLHYREMRLHRTESRMRWRNGGMLRPQQRHRLRQIERRDSAAIYRLKQNRRRY